MSEMLTNAETPSFLVAEAFVPVLLGLAALCVYYVLPKYIQDEEDRDTKIAIVFCLTSGLLSAQTQMLFKVVTLQIRIAVNGNPEAFEQPYLYMVTVLTISCATTQLSLLN